MIHVQAQRRWPWAGMLWLSAVVLGVLAAAITGSLVILLVVASVALASIIAMGAGVANRRSSASARIAWVPMPQRSISTADGVTQSALVVPIKRADGYEMVLTVDGYMLIDQTGQEVYRLRRW
jgi:hypothetical protein